MKNLTDILYESVLGNIDSTIEDYVEMEGKMAKDLTWVKHVKIDDAVHYEAALFSVTYKAFARAPRMSDDERRAFGVFMINAASPWGCFNWTDADDWEEREYCEQPSFYIDNIKGLGMVNATADNKRWSKSGSNSFFNYFWDEDNTHSLDQEDLLKHKQTQKYIKQLIKVAQKYGLGLKPIF